MTLGDLCAGFVAIIFRLSTSKATSYIGKNYCEWKFQTPLRKQVGDLWSQLKNMHYILLKTHKTKSWIIFPTAGSFMSGYKSDSIRSTVYITSWTGVLNVYKPENVQACVCSASYVGVHWRRECRYYPQTRCSRCLLWQDSGMLKLCFTALYVTEHRFKENESIFEFRDLTVILNCE